MTQDDVIEPKSNKTLKIVKINTINRQNEMSTQKDEQKTSKECQEPTKSFDIGSAVVIVSGDGRVARIAALIDQTVDEEESVTNETSVTENYDSNDETTDYKDKKQIDTSSVKELIKTLAETIDATIDAVEADASNGPEDDLLVAECEGKLKCNVPGCLII